MSRTAHFLAALLVALLAVTSATTANGWPQKQQTQIPITVQKCNQFGVFTGDQEQNCAVVPIQSGTSTSVSGGIRGLLNYEKKQTQVPITVQKCNQLGFVTFDEEQNCAVVPIQSGTSTTVSGGIRGLLTEKKQQTQVPITVQKCNQFGIATWGEEQNCAVVPIQSGTSTSVSGGIRGLLNYEKKQTQVPITVQKCNQFGFITADEEQNCAVVPIQSGTSTTVTGGIRG